MCICVCVWVQRWCVVCPLKHPEHFPQASVWDVKAHLRAVLKQRPQTHTMTNNPKDCRSNRIENSSNLLWRNLKYGFIFISWFNMRFNLHFRIFKGFYSYILKPNELHVRQKLGSKILLAPKKTCYAKNKKQYCMYLHKWCNVRIFIQAVGWIFLLHIF